MTEGQKQTSQIAIVDEKRRTIFIRNAAAIKPALAAPETPITAPVIEFQPKKIVRRRRKGEKKIPVFSIAPQSPVPNKAVPVVLDLPVDISETLGYKPTFKFNQSNRRPKLTFFKPSILKKKAKAVRGPPAPRKVYSEAPQFHKKGPAELTSMPGPSHSRKRVLPIQSAMEHSDSGEEETFDDFEKTTSPPPALSPNLDESDVLSDDKKEMYQPQFLEKSQLSFEDALDILSSEIPSDKVCSQFPVVLNETVGVFVVRWRDIPRVFRSPEGTVWTWMPMARMYLDRQGRRFGFTADTKKAKPDESEIGFRLFRDKFECSGNNQQHLFRLIYRAQESVHMDEDAKVLLCVGRRTNQSWAMTSPCPHCSKEFNGYPNLVRHIDAHHKSAKVDWLICQECGFEESKTKKRQLDFFKHDCHPRESTMDEVLEGFGKFRCTMCALAFPDRRMHLYHMKKSHPVVESMNSCPVCPEFMADFMELKAHMSAWHPDQTLAKCPHCFFAVFSPCDGQALARHVKKAHQKPPRPIKIHYCSTCGRGFKQAMCARNCQLRHSEGERCYVCELCGKVFPTNAKRGVHRRKVHVERSPCPHCGKTFHPDHMNFHLETMHSEEELLCSGCGKKFFSRSRLLRHEQKEHGINLEVPIEVCEQCGKGFRGITAKMNLKDHIESQHEGVRWTCAQCGRVYKNKKAMGQHQKLVCDGSKRKEPHSVETGEIV